MKILTLIAVYLPGYRAGGPIRTVSNLVELLWDTFEFWILTGDRDLNDSESYPGVLLDRWVSVDRANVYYTDLRALSLRKLSQLVLELNPDIVYLNSFFSSLNNRYLLARWLGMIPRIPTIVAPRGVFSPGALRLKSTKKRIYLQTVQRAGVLNGLQWQASTLLEKRDIMSALPTVAASDIYVAVNPVDPHLGGQDAAANGRGLSKSPGSVRFIFLARISSKKNLKFALQLLKTLNGRVDFDIYGPLEDEAYWKDCLQIIATLPENVTVHAHGAVAHEEVSSVLSQAHFFLFPTLGENFGHVIFEALRAGCPALISDQTPWHDLAESEAGWDMPLDQEHRWRRVMQNCVDMSQEDFTRHSEKAGQFARQWLATSGMVQANREMFQAVAGGPDA